MSNFLHQQQQHSQKPFLHTVMLISNLHRDKIAFEWNSTCFDDVTMFVETRAKLGALPGQTHRPEANPIFRARRQVIGLHNVKVIAFINNNGVALRISSN